MFYLHSRDFMTCTCSSERVLSSWIYFANRLSDSKSVSLALFWVSHLAINFHDPARINMKGNSFMGANPRYKLVWMSGRNLLDLGICRIGCKKRDNVSICWRCNLFYFFSDFRGVLESAWQNIPFSATDRGFVTSRFILYEKKRFL